MAYGEDEKLHSDDSRFAFLCMRTSAKQSLANINQYNQYVISTKCKGSITIQFDAALLLPATRIIEAVLLCVYRSTLHCGEVERLMAERLDARGSPEPVAGVKSTLPCVAQPLSTGMPLATLKLPFVSLALAVTAIWVTRVLRSASRLRLRRRG